MTDIVERLRKAIKVADFSVSEAALIGDAADEIEHLRGYLRDVIAELKREGVDPPPPPQGWKPPA